MSLQPTVCLNLASGVPLRGWYPAGAGHGHGHCLAPPRPVPATGRL